MANGLSGFRQFMWDSGTRRVRDLGPGSSNLQILEDAIKRSLFIKPNLGPSQARRFDYPFLSRKSGRPINNLRADQRKVDSAKTKDLPQ